MAKTRFILWLLGSRGVGWQIFLPPLLCCLLSLSVRAQPPGNAVPIAVSRETGGQAAGATVEAAVTLPGKTTFRLHAPANVWITLATLEFDLFWPETAPAKAQVLVYLKDWDYFWYQALLPGYLVPGKTNHLRVDLQPSAKGWTARGHHGVWNLRTRIEPKEVGVTVFGDTAYQGTCRLGEVWGIRQEAERTPPYIRSVRANANSVASFEKFELTFELPDRYPDPFDPLRVSVVADFETPKGQHTRIDGFYGLGYYREKAVSGDEVLPQGPPYWRVRFCPLAPGTYRYTLTVKDAVGETRWGPGTFEATAAQQPGFVRVSKADPRFFEFDNGSPFFPIGHNIRSPFDTRMDGAFPWAQRWAEGSSAYIRYFDSMRQHGETLAEVWTAAWSLGLEWSPLWRGYHGVGRYNMINAWELDRVVEAAEKNGIYLNLVINNHGKFSTWSDQEWAGNPFNLANGGYLNAPEEFFTDTRAQDAFRKLMRYMVARWGYSTRIFAWQLWSELDLVGSYQGLYHRPEVVAWHRQMGQYVRQIDPYAHLISSHVSGDYTRQNPQIMSLPEMDFCPTDAYHGNADPVFIVTLMRQTAEFNNPYGKPVMITEFGGSPHASDLKHLDETLHAALWASTATPLGATPLFWWWQLIEEENFYPKYSAVSKFMAGVDRRDPAMRVSTPVFTREDNAVPGLDVQCLKSRNQALGWIFYAAAFATLDPARSPATTGILMELKEMSDGPYYVEFWDTVSGRCIVRDRVHADRGVLSLAVPPFVRDIAFKVQPATGKK